VPATLAAALAAGCGPDAEVGRRSDAWLRLEGNSQATVLLDTTRFTAHPDGEANVFLRYELGSPIEVPTRPGARISVVESEEVTECAQNTARALWAILRDSAGGELGRTTTAPGERSPSMVGGAGSALCDYVRARRGGETGRGPS
jgi:hypothetical protein